MDIHSQQLSINYKFFLIKFFIIYFYFLFLNKLNSNQKNSFHLLFLFSINKLQTIIPCENTKTTMVFYFDKSHQDFDQVTQKVENDMNNY